VAISIGNNANRIKDKRSASSSSSQSFPYGYENRRSVCSGPDLPFDDTVEEEIDSKPVEEHYHTMEELSRSVDNFLKVIFPIAYCIYLAKNLPEGSLDDSKPH